MKDGTKSLNIRGSNFINACFVGKIKISDAHTNILHTTIWVYERHTFQLHFQIHVNIFMKLLKHPHSTIHSAVTFQWD